MESVIFLRQSHYEGKKPSWEGAERQENDNSFADEPLCVIQLNGSEQDERAEHDHEKDGDSYDVIILAALVVDVDRPSHCNDDWADKKVCQVENGRGLDAAEGGVRFAHETDQTVDEVELGDEAQDDEAAFTL